MMFRLIVFFGTHNSHKYADTHKPGFPQALLGLGSIFDTQLVLNKYYLLNNECKLILHKSQTADAEILLLPGA